MSEVRRAGPADAAIVRELRLESLRLHPTSYWTAYEEEADWPLERYGAWTEAETILLGFAGGEPVGLLALIRAAKAKLRHKAVIGCVYVKESARGRGVARAMMQAALDEARAMGLRQVTLAVNVDNPARRIYERLGFEVFAHERMALKYEGRFYDEYQMVRLLEAD